MGKVNSFHGRDETEVVEVDVERAWREGGFESGWSNEVSLEVFVR